MDRWIICLYHDGDEERVEGCPKGRWVTGVCGRQLHINDRAHCDGTRGHVCVGDCEDGWIDPRRGVDDLTSLDADEGGVTDSCRGGCCIVAVDRGNGGHDVKEEEPPH